MKTDSILQDAGAACQQQACSAFVVVVGYPRNSMAGQYLEGPRDPKTVKKLGYGFTPDIAKAWPFPNERQAKAKALIVDRHMGWGEGVLIAEPNAPHQATASDGRSNT
jgi:hypothetical protein